jgi:hypothetical protein
MEQHDARPRGITTLEIMEPKALALDETTDRRVPSFSDKRERHIPNNQQKENTRDDGENGFSSGHSLRLGTPVAGRIAASEGVGLRHNLVMSPSFLAAAMTEKTGMLRNGLTEIALLGKELGQVINLQSAES